MSRTEARVIAIMFILSLFLCGVIVAVMMTVHRVERPLTRARADIPILPLADLPGVAARSGQVPDGGAGSGEWNIEKPTPTGNANDVTSDRSHGARDIDSSVAGQTQRPVTNQSIPHLAVPTENVIQPSNDTRIILAASSPLTPCHSLVVTSGAPFGATSVTVAHKPDIGALITKDGPIVGGKFNLTLCVPTRSSDQYQVDSTFHPKGETVRAILHEFAVQVGAKQ